jgi:hypothetical protein
MTLAERARSQILAMFNRGDAFYQKGTLQDHNLGLPQAC